MAPGFPSASKPSSYFEEAPRTPPMHDDFDTNVPSEVNATGRKTRGSVASDSSEEQQSAIDSPTQPFVAYGRRRRSFSSPFQLNKERYVLSFADAETAREWWHLVQSEYPDSVRESPQRFSFKSDGIPDKAQRNHKFALLKDKWSYRQLEESEAKKYQEEKGSLSHRRASFARTPSMPTLREGSVVSGFGSLEDPFTPGGADSMPDRKDFAQLNITSDRIQKAVSQSTSQLDALLEGQQASAKGMQKLNATIESITLQMEALAKWQREHEYALQEFRYASAREASTGNEYRQAQADAVNALHLTMEHTSSRVQDLVDRPVPPPGLSAGSLQDLQSFVGQNTSALQSSVGQNTTALQLLGSSVAQNTTGLQLLTESHKTTKKTLQKLQSLVETTSAEQKALALQVKQIKALSENTHALTTRLAQDQDKRFEQLSGAMERQAVQTKKMFAAQQNSFKAQQESFKASLNEILEAVKKQPQSVSIDCDHEILPPPRKVSRKLVGYVYEKE